ncbi:hypothetical protein ERO13_D06G107251v2 [Gossypium hirsutum]|uniref:Importin subunit alpha-2 n=1 Tax=Gossypium hirsutum TaxID=3635 RepID=A0A1U8IYI6_GOSHI|nr:importin subunit alpha-2-like [Gossypium hirsutum]XP_016683197.2 importin subunit alpha-2-like [Gossypium hirsutum]KAG4141993.1 hypothetical protein ERO13_D06G107251v2 [Gossypium hirsutum]KAG4141994.1 hypothetical protein ERO13_D06G107251v2 [Gossypium hirsutum]KAG4141995.1 hypothetical protein ERO13_D06G107251v2 [Gossypium hirsutum]
MNSSLGLGLREDVIDTKLEVAVDAEEGRRRREYNMVEIRKNHREESLQKKRREGLQAQPMLAFLHSSAVEKKEVQRCLMQWRQYFKPPLPWEDMEELMSSWVIWKVQLYCIQRLSVY